MVTHAAAELSSEHGRVSIELRRGLWVITGHRADGDQRPCVITVDECYGCGDRPCPKTTRACRCGGHHLDSGRCL